MSVGSATFKTIDCGTSQLAMPEDTFEVRSVHNVAQSNDFIFNEATSDDGDYCKADNYTLDSCEYWDRHGVHHIKGVNF